MSASVKLSSKLPGDFEVNGLDSFAQDLIDDPQRLRIAVVWLDTQKVTVDTDSGTEVPTVRVRRIEPLGDAGEVSQAIRDAVGAAMEERTGRTPLPFEIAQVFPEHRDQDALDGVDD